MAAPGATSPLPGALAKARQPNPQRPFAVGSGTGRRRMAKSAGRARGSKWLKSMVNVAPRARPGAVTGYARCAASSTCSSRQRTDLQPLGPQS